jgi:hypothetical protein
MDRTGCRQLNRILTTAKLTLVKSGIQTNPYGAAPTKAFTHREKSTKRTPLHAAVSAYATAPEVVKRLLAVRPAAIMEECSDGYTRRVGTFHSRYFVIAVRLVQLQLVSRLGAIAPVCPSLLHKDMQS